jgi:4-alpha-glucanotransferase
MFAILPLQDWLATDASLRRSNPHAERINIPAVPRHYWRYRMHLTVDALLAASTFNTRLKRMIKSAGRG